MTKEKIRTESSAEQQNRQGDVIKSSENPHRQFNGDMLINEPFRGQPLLCNRLLAPQDRELLEQTIPQEESLKFLVVGDLSMQSNYAQSMLAVTDQMIYGFDESFEDGVKTLSYSSVKKAFVKRCYGNALLVFSKDDSEGDKVDLSKQHDGFLRFSYKVASLYDAAAHFIQNVAAGKDMDEEMKSIESAFTKQFSFCPRCGRRLIRPGATCMNCQSKKRSFKRSYPTSCPTNTCCFFACFCPALRPRPRWCRRI